MLTQRQKKLVRLLERETAAQTIGYFASKLGVSERTLSSEISELQSIGYPIERKRGIGILLSSCREAKDDNDEQDEQLKRRIEIIVVLLFHQKSVTFTGLSEYFFVSKTSIKQDLEFISDLLLKGTDGKLISDRTGTRIEFSTLKDKILVYTRFNQFILNKKQSVQGSLSVDGIEYLKEYYQPDIIQVCNNALFTYVREHVNSISEIYVQNFLCLLISHVNFLVAGESIEVNHKIFDKKQHAFYIESAVSILHKISLRLEFEFSNGDIEFLSENLLLCRFEQVPVQLFDQQIISDLIAKVSQVMEIDFSVDQELICQLKAHIPAMISRLKHSGYVRNPFTEQIKLEFSVMFNILWLAMIDFGREIDVTFNEDEIAFLTIYFQLSLEKLGNSRKILVVCAMGIVTSELLINRIKNTMPSLDKLEIASVKEAEELDLTSYDLVLSTVPLKSNKKHVYAVSPFTSPDELTNLLQLTKHEVVHTASIQTGLKEHLKEQFIFINPRLHSSQEIIAFVSEELQKNGYVKAGFFQTVIHREKLGNTDLPGGIAIPHGNPQEVLKTFVALVKLPKKFKWKDYFVDLIFVIGIHSNDMKETKAVVSNIYELTQSPDILKQLRQAQTKKEVLKAIYGE